MSSLEFNEAFVSAIKVFVGQTFMVVNVALLNSWELANANVQNTCPLFIVYHFHLAPGPSRDCSGIVMLHTLHLAAGNEAIY